VPIERKGEEEGAGNGGATNTAVVAYAMKSE